ncbi:MAG: GGDEF domain-containing protein [Proteobacteria bacterium]|nr:GGDEF domain-containing protein [Pseudomonadota bacterium]
MGNKQNDTIGGMMKKRTARKPVTVAEPMSDYDKLMVEYLRLQQQFLDQQALIGSMAQDTLADPITGLASRKTLMAEIEKSLSTAQRYGRQHALVMVEIADFNNLQERLGRKVGDGILQHIGRLLRQNIRPTDIAARLEAGRFCVILNELKALENAEMRSGAISEIISQTPYMDEQRSVHVLAQVGCCLFGADDDAEDLMRKVETLASASGGKVRM